MGRGFVRPFNQTHPLPQKVLVQARIEVLLRLIKPIKIKMKKVYA